MSPERQTRKLADFLGRYIPEPDFNCDPENDCYDECHGSYVEALKEFCTLDVIRAARQAIPVNLRNDYIASLWKVTGNELSVNFWSEYNFRGIYACIDATPEHEREAILRTMGLWEDDENGKH